MENACLGLIEGLEGLERNLGCLCAGKFVESQDCVGGRAQVSNTRLRRVEEYKEVPELAGPGVA